jgi:Dyp-type peroxidase family
MTSTRTAASRPVDRARNRPARAPSAQDADVDLADVQGIVGSGYGRLPQALFLGLRIDDGVSGRAFLSALLPQVTTMAAAGSGRAVNVAITHAGLAQLGLPSAALDMFSLEFAAGMVTPGRSAFLGDQGEHAPSAWSWGGPDQPRVDLLVLLYAESPDELAALTDSVRGLIGVQGPVEVLALPTATLTPRNHLGFVDGISQPVPTGLHDTSEGNVALGEFLLGHRNAYGKLTSRPLLPADADPQRLLPPATDAPGHVDFGRNGSYLVVRTLAQDVDAFWDFARLWAGRTGMSPVQVAAKLVGRWPSGTSLAVSPDHDDPGTTIDNDFGYHHGDAQGLRCPVAAHVRRANPRDSLDPRPGSAASVQVTNRHRIIRRGREYGPVVPDDGADGERGLHFLCLNANIARQFEFIQHTWLNNPAFAGLQESPDPLVGPRAPGADLFVSPALPVRYRPLQMPTFVRVRGGGYFFLPGLSALRHLTSAPTRPSAPDRKDLR